MEQLSVDFVGMKTKGQLIIIRRDMNFKKTLRITGNFVILVFAVFVDSNMFGQEMDISYPPTLSACRFVDYGEKIFIGQFLEQANKRNSKNEDTAYAKFLVNEPLFGMKEHEKKEVELANLAYNTPKYFHKFLEKKVTYAVFSWINKKSLEYELVAPIPVIRIKSNKTKAAKSKKEFQVFFGDFNTDSDNLKGVATIFVRYKKKVFSLNKFDSSGAFAIVYPKGADITTIVEVSKKLKIYQALEDISELKFSNVYSKKNKTIFEFNLPKDIPCSEKLFEFEEIK
jgi:hypothetical protein